MKYIHHNFILHHFLDGSCLVWAFFSDDNLPTNEEKMAPLGSLNGDEVNTFPNTPSALCALKSCIQTHFFLDDLYCDYNMVEMPRRNMYARRYFVRAYIDCEQTRRDNERAERRAV